MLCSRDSAPICSCNRGAKALGWHLFEPPLQVAATNPAEMGAGASTLSPAGWKDLIRNDVLGSHRPLDASDVEDLESAKAEIRRIRRLAMEYIENDRAMHGGQKSTTARGGRAAILGVNTKVNPGEYQKKVVPKNDAIRRVIIEVVRTNIMFKSCRQEERQEIADAFEKLEMSAGDTVIRQGDHGDLFYVVESGILDVYLEQPNGDEPAKIGSPLGGGASFGELALMYNTPRAATIKARTDCVLWTLDRTTFRTIMVHFKQRQMMKQLGFIENVVIGGKRLGDFLDRGDLEKLAMALDVDEHEEGSVIVRQGEHGDNFYIIKEGEVVVHKSEDPVNEFPGEEMTVLRTGAYFGERALLSEDVRAATCIARTSVTCLTLERNDFIHMLGDLQDLLIKKPKAPRRDTEEPVNTNAMKEEVFVDDLTILKTLGVGAFGRVKLAKKQSTDQYYALKCLEKQTVLDTGLQDHVLSEMRVMSKLDHPFIAKFHAALQDSRYIYLLLELLIGGELFLHLRAQCSYTEPHGRFYGAIVLSAFEHIHSKKIAYRDLKPENLVFDNAGYIKLVDFGLAKMLHTGKAWTLCGTPDYLAPEIILNEGHDLAVDYWAYGVLIYEMMAGATPFFAQNPMEVYEKILTGSYLVPPTFSKHLTDLIKKLLRAHPSKRLGNTKGGTSAVMKHKWFNGFDWEGLMNRTVRAPYVPDLSGPEDTSHFDNFDEEEQLPPECFDWNPDLLTLNAEPNHK